MKTIALTLVCAFFGAVFAEAHSGRTDKDGGHTDRKTGTYHKHGSSKR